MCFSSGYGQKQGPVIRILNVLGYMNSTRKEDLSLHRSISYHINNKMLIVTEVATVAPLLS